MDESATSWAGVEAWLSLYSAEIGGCFPALTKGEWAFRVRKAGRILVFAPDVSSLRAGSSVRAIELLDRRVRDPVQVQYRWRATAVMELPSIPGRSLADSPHRRRSPGVQRRLIGANLFVGARVYKCGSIMAGFPREIAGWQREAALTKHDRDSVSRENEDYLP